MNVPERLRTVFVWAAFLAVVVLALVFRVIQLDRRVAHNDEANQVYKTGVLYDTGVYHYDAYEHHGPSLYYLSVPLLKLSGAAGYAQSQLPTYRLLPALFGVGLVLLLLMTRRGLGWGETWVAALLTAVSSGMTYYSRFYIQEILLVFFTFGLIACGWRYLKNRKLVWAIAAGACAGLMHATKETCVIAYACAGLGLVLTVIWCDRGLSLSRFKVQPSHVVGAVLTTIIVSVVLFSSFFTHPVGVLDSIRTYFTYLERGSGESTEHVYPFMTYLQTLVYQKDGGLVWSEGVIMALGLIGLVLVACNAAVVRKADVGLSRFLVVYTVLMTLAYSAIPYKTPWCMLSFLHGWILLAGIGAVGVFRLLGRWPLQLVWVLVVAFGVEKLSTQTCHAVFRFGADARNPYAYGHTVQPYMNLVNRVHDVAATHPDGKAMRIAVVTTPADAWPSPWYLRAYPNVGYWTSVAELPEGFDPSVLIVSADLEDDFTTQTRDAFVNEYWGLRVDALLGLYIKKDAWDLFMASRGG